MALTLKEKFSKKVQEKNHELITYVEGAGYKQPVHTIKCICGGIYQTSWANYKRSKNCKKCQPASVSKHWAEHIHPNTKHECSAKTGEIPFSPSEWKNKGKAKIISQYRYERIKNKKDLYVETNNGQRKRISSKEEMLTFLQQNPNLYNSFILPFCLQPGSLLTKNVSKKDKNKGLDNHHIIPLASGGTDQPYNIVRLPKADHIIAHCLLAKLTNKPSDHLAVRMFKQHLKLDSDQLKKRRNIQKALDLVSHYSFKKERKAVQMVDNFKIATIDYFKNDTYWSHPALKDKFIVKGGCVKQLKDLQPILVEALPTSCGQRKTLAELNSRSFRCRISNLMRGVCCSLHGWVWAEPDVNVNLRNNFSQKEEQPKENVYQGNFKKCLQTKTQLLWYHAELSQPIVMHPSTVKRPLKIHLFQLFIEQAGWQNQKVAEKIKNVNPRDFCNLILKVFHQQYKTAYGFFLNKKDLKNNNTTLLQKEMHWEHNCIHYSPTQKTVVVPANSLPYLNSLQGLFLTHLKQLNINNPHAFKNKNNPHKYKTQIQSNINSLEKLSSNNFSAALARYINKNCSHEKQVFGFQLVKTINKNTCPPL